ncbi:MAG: septal ring lytic transglycosylase RlpA family protein [Candidatus Cloacimonetes bacterium]|nr:septal ring lytic transglycosylase RlpA family protein [Candidatus Cloacimonadota bacterium]
MLLLIMGCSSNTLYETNGAYKRTHKKFGSSEDIKKEMKVKKGQVYYFVCSFYGKKFHGKQTANGEIFDMNKLTCAHKSLPFGTLLKVTNEDNGNSVVVRVNDRGPFVQGRDLDLSYAAAEKVGIIGAGVKKLKVEVLENE